MSPIGKKMELAIAADSLKSFFIDFCKEILFAFHCFYFARISKFHWKQGRHRSFILVSQDILRSFIDIQFHHEAHKINFFEVCGIFIIQLI